MKTGSQVTPETTGIYELKFPNMKKNEFPLMEVYQLVEGSNTYNMFGAFNGKKKTCGHRGAYWGCRRTCRLRRACEEAEEPVDSEEP